MNKHFAYLTNNDEATFFQKVANELAESKMVPATASIAKVASARPMIKVAAFDKIAARLDQDLTIIKTAGACGMNLGMQKRAGAYLDRVLDHDGLTAEQFDQIFDKVAGEAITTDLEAAYAHLSDGMSPELAPWLEGEIAKIGHELVKEAMLEKEALRALLGAGLKSLGRGVGHVLKSPVTATRAVGQGIQNMRINSGTRSLARTEASLANREGMIADRAASGKTGVISRAKDRFDQDVASGLRNKATSTKATIDKLTNKNLAKYSPTGPSKSSVSAAPAAAPAAGASPSPTPNPAAAAPPASPKGKGGTPAAAAPKGKKGRKGKGGTPAANTPANASPPPVPGAGTPGQAASGANTMNAASGAGITMKEAYEKARDLGWKALSGDEKQKLITAGAAVVVGGRVVLGGGILTGGDGLV